MQTIKLNLHSAVDLITNSSTTIFTYSSGCIQPCKDLVTEFLKLSNSNKTFDDLFFINVFLADSDIYSEYADDNDIEVGEIDQLIDDILTEKMEKPQWMIECEENENWSGYTNSTHMYIKAKTEETEKLAATIVNFLYSPWHEACREG